MTKLRKSDKMDDRITSVKNKEKMLRAVLFPVESFVLEVERILLWERPIISSLLLVAVNILFWLTATCQVLSLIGIIGFLTVFIDGLICHYWPEKAGGGAKIDDEWIELHPQFMGIAEISIKFAEIWQTVEDQVMNTVKLRRRNRPKFFVSSVFILSTLAVVGTYMSDLFIIYLTVNSVLIFPAVRYHNIISRINKAITPVDTKSDRKLKKGKRERGKRLSIVEDEEEELKEFLPTKTVSIVRQRYSKARNDANRSGTERVTVLNQASEQKHDLRHQVLMNDFEKSYECSDDDLISTSDLSYFTRDFGLEMPSISSNFDSLATFIPQQHDMPSFDQLDSSFMSRSGGNISLVSADFQPSSDEEDGDYDDEVKDPAGYHSFIPSAQAHDLSITDSVSTTGRDMAAMLGDMIVQGGASFSSVVASSAPVVGSAISATAIKLGNMAAVVRDAAISATVGSSQVVVTDESITRESEELSSGDENDFEFIGRQELNDLNKD